MKIVLFIVLSITTLGFLVTLYLMSDFQYTVESYWNKFIACLKRWFGV